MEIYAIPLAMLIVSMATYFRSVSRDRVDSLERRLAECERDCKGHRDRVEILEQDKIRLLTMLMERRRDEP